MNISKIISALILMASIQFASATDPLPQPMLGLKAYWTFEAVTPVIPDVSNHGSNLGVTEGGQIALVPGMLDNAFDLLQLTALGTGANPGDPVWAQAPNKGFTVASWFKISEWAPGYHGIISLRGAGGTIYWFLWFPNSYNLYLTMADASGTPQNLLVDLAGGRVLDGLWHYIVFGYDPITHQMWFVLDNAPKQSLTLANGIYHNDAEQKLFRLGRYYGDNYPYLDCGFDDSGYWSRCLTPTEIDWLYCQGWGRVWPDEFYEK